MSGNLRRTRRQNKKQLKRISTTLRNKIKKEDKAFDAAFKAYNSAIESKNKEEILKRGDSFDEHYKNVSALSAELAHVETEYRKLRGLDDEKWKPLEKKWEEEMRGQKLGGVMVRKTRRNTSSGGGH